MKHIRKFESYRIKKHREEIIKESVLQVNDIYKVKTMIDIPQSLINAYVKKVKDTTGKNLRQFFGDVDIAEEIVKYINLNNLDVDKIPGGALMGGQTQAQGQGGQMAPQAQTEPMAQQPQAQTQGQAQPQAQGQAQPQAQAQGQAQAPQVQVEGGEGQSFEEPQAQGQAQPQAQAQGQAQAPAAEGEEEEAQGEGEGEGEEELPL